MNQQDEQERYEHALNSTLSGLKADPWLAQRILHSERGKEKMKKKVSFGFVLILALLLVSMVAVAVTLVQRSEEANTMMVANQALFEKYGLNDQTVGLFTRNAREDGDKWMVTYVPNGYAPVLLGQYQVIVQNGKAVTTAWSYDDAKDDWRNGDLTSAIWGQKQLEMALENPDEASAISAPLYEIDPSLPLPDENRQEGDAWWLGEMVHPSAPGAEDITKEAAMVIAIQALTDEYDLQESDITRAMKTQTDAGMDAGEPLFYKRDCGKTIWTFGFQLVKEDISMDLAVVIDAGSGEVLETKLLTGGNG